MTLITEAIFLVFFIAINLIFLLQIGEFPQEGWDHIGPAAYPRLLLVSILILLGITLFNTIRKISIEQKSGNIEISFKEVKNMLLKYKKVIITLLLFAAYIYFMYFLGFRIATFTYLFISQWYLSSREKKDIPKILITSIIIAFGVSYFFEMFLGVIFPRGVIF